MKSAPIPENEPDRLKALQRYGILDTQSEELFDSIARLAATICDVPIALVSLIDTDRQWFKARVGLDATETHRDLAFCAHAILKPDEMLVVPDATQDERFHDNPLVSNSPDIRFYAGAPIVTPDNQALGTLCVIDRKPRELTDRQNEALQNLSKQVCANLDLRLKSKQLELLNESKNRYFSILSHDLRSPLYSVISISEMLSDDDDQFGTEERKEFLTHLQNNAKTTLTIAENLLKMAQFEQGSFNYNPELIKIDSVVETAKFAVSGKLKAKKIELETNLDPELTAWVDRPILQSILQNLVSNAAKFTNENGKISITGIPKDNIIEIRVADNGIGIPEEILSRIFDLDSCYSTQGTDGEKGSGLGLTLCKQFAEKLGGSLTLESEYKVGTTAILKIPATEN